MEWKIYPEITLWFSLVSIINSACLGIILTFKLDYSFYGSIQKINFLLINCKLIMFSILSDPVSYSGDKKWIIAMSGASYHVWLHWKDLDMQEDGKVFMRLTEAILHRLYWHWCTLCSLHKRILHFIAGICAHMGVKSCHAFHCQLDDQLCYAFARKIRSHLNIDEPYSLYTFCSWLSSFHFSW